MLKNLCALTTTLCACSKYEVGQPSFNGNSSRDPRSPALDVKISPDAHFGTISSVSTGANEPNEDRVISFRAQVRDANGNTVNDLDVMGVFDGHGGRIVSEYVSRNFPIVFSNYLTQTTNVTEALLSTFHTLERSVRHLLFNDRGVAATYSDQRFNVGACGLVVVVIDDGIISANIGDSRALAVDDSHGYFRLNREHNSGKEDEQRELLLKFPDEKDVIRCYRRGVCYVKGRLQPTRSFGDFSLKERIPGLAFTQERSFNPPYISAVPEILSYSKDNVKFIVLGSDGVWELIDDKQMSPLVDELKGDATMIKDRALLKAWRQAGISEAQYSQLPGKRRRSIVDDLSVIVLQLH